MTAPELTALLPLFDRGTVAVLTGTGVSTDSGIPDYHGPGTVPRTPMSIAQFMTDEHYRKRFWAGARIGSLTADAVRPNDGHRALTALEAAGRIPGVITQNVDSLHREAGTRELVELHGNGSRIVCTACGTVTSRAETLRQFDRENPGYVDLHRDAEVAPDGDARVSESNAVTVPACLVCGGILRPQVVYFGEVVPAEVFAAAEAQLAAAEALLCVGTSLTVNTGIRLVHRAERRGIPVGVINRGPTAIDHRATVRVEAGTSETLRALAEALG